MIRRALPVIALCACVVGGTKDGTSGSQDSASLTGGDSATDSPADTARHTGAPTASEPMLILRAPAEGAAYDECEEVCFAAVATRDGAPLVGVEATVELDEGGVIGTAETNAEGGVELCTAGIAPGARQVAFTFRVDGTKYRTFGTFTVHPFGYALGLLRPSEELTEIPWTPSLTRHEGNPVFAGEGTWDAEGVLLPSIAPTDTGWYMVYAGTPDEDYQVGAALSTDGLSWTPVEGNPALPMTGAGWNATATNSPVVLFQGGGYWVWYTGRSAADVLKIGLARSPDGVTYAESESNPVFAPDDESSAWEGTGVAHPSILRRGALYEMWYSTNEHKLGYAISTDGKAWERYCGNPIFEGEVGTWEDGQVKSAEVAFDGDRYVMTYAGGSTGAFQVGWAASADGLRWIRSEAPILSPAEPGTWEGVSVLGAALVLEDDTVRVWYSGTSAAGSAIGYAEATR